MRSRRVAARLTALRNPRTSQAGRLKRVGAEVEVLREHRRRGLCLSGPGSPGKPSQDVAYEREPGRDSLTGSTPHFVRHRGLVVRDVPVADSKGRCGRPTTSWAMSLSGVQITIRSTRGSAAKRFAAAPIASSASHSTIGQRTTPQRLDRLLRDGELAQELACRMPALDL